MRVLQLIDTLEAGGAERMAVTLANALVTEVERSYLCTTRAEGLLKASIQPEVGYLFLKRTKTLDLSAVRQLVSFIKQEQITIIHAHASSFFIATLVKWMYPKVYLIWHDHYGNSQFVAQRPKRVLKICSQAFSHILAVNDTLKAWDSTTLYCKAVDVVPNFVSPKATVLETPIQGQAGKRIVCLANLRAQKDHITLLHAFKQIHKTYPDWTLHCVGKNFEDDYAEEVFNTLKQLQLDDSVFFYGSCADVPAILDHMDIGVLSSQSEGLPLALLEYGMAGLAVVATTVGDCDKVIVNRSMGRLVPARDASLFADAVLNLIAENPLRMNMRDALQQYVQQHYSETNCLNHILSVYGRIV
ncbi:glycosyltransferase [Formosa sp. 4Alg 33]|uniref:glycosyltransferase n=1 Tax=Formosa sp. 4Alg 33 TaxID=3382189 RepID=UPI003D9C2DC5